MRQTQRQACPCSDDVQQKLTCIPVTQAGVIRKFAEAAQQEALTSEGEECPAFCCCCCCYLLSAHVALHGVHISTMSQLCCGTNELCVGKLRGNRLQSVGTQIMLQQLSRFCNMF